MVKSRLEFSQNHTVPHWSGLLLKCFAIHKVWYPPLFDVAGYLTQACRCVVVQNDSFDHLHDSYENKIQL